MILIPADYFRSAPVLESAQVLAHVLKAIIWRDNADELSRYFVRDDAQSIAWLQARGFVR